MLRRKLLLVFGVLVLSLMAMAFTGIYLLQKVLWDLDHLNAEAIAAVDQTTRLNTLVTRLEIQLYELQVDKTRRLDSLISSVESLQQYIGQIGSYEVVQLEPTKSSYRHLCTKIPRLTDSISSLATAQDVNLARTYNLQALNQVVTIREDVASLDSAVRGHARQEQVVLAGRLRWLVLAMALGWLLIVNIWAIALLKLSAIVVRPVDQLVEASRQLTREKFEHRTHVQPGDEFYELGQAYNHLAERLQSSEQRKMEMLGQVALTLNHEIKNAIATIELQLELISRHPHVQGKIEACLRQIHQSLRRMADTVESLKHIRRIVLTDYLAGVKMLDLQQSVQDEPVEKNAPPRPTP